MDGQRLPFRPKIFPSNKNSNSLEWIFKVLFLILPSNSQEIINKFQKQRFESWRMLQIWQSQYLTWEILWKIIMDQLHITQFTRNKLPSSLHIMCCKIWVFDMATNEKEMSITQPERTETNSSAFWTPVLSNHLVFYWLLPFLLFCMPLFSSLSFAHLCTPEGNCCYIFGSNEFTGLVPKLLNHSD